jgi:hypothetical protein
MAALRFWVARHICWCPIKMLHTYKGSNRKALNRESERLVRIGPIFRPSQFGVAFGSKTWRELRSYNLFKCSQQSVVLGSLVLQCWPLSAAWEGRPRTHQRQVSKSASSIITKPNFKTERNLPPRRSLESSSYSWGILQCPPCRGDHPVRSRNDPHRGMDNGICLPSHRRSYPRFLSRHKYSPPSFVFRILGEYMYA